MTVPLLLAVAVLAWRIRRLEARQDYLEHFYTGHLYAHDNAHL